MWGGGGGRSLKNLFRLFGPPFGLKLRGGVGGGPPGSLPWIRHRRKFRTGDHDKMAWKLANKLDSDETKNT